MAGKKLAYAWCWFYKLSVEDRMAQVADWAGLDENESGILMDRGLKASQANMMIENVVGTYELPLGIACNFLINGKDYLVPAMTVEEAQRPGGCQQQRQGCSGRRWLFSHRQRIQS